jgi:hypothetical protein
MTLLRVLFFKWKLHEHSIITPKRRKSVSANLKIGTGKAPPLSSVRFFRMQKRRHRQNVWDRITTWKARSIICAPANKQWFPRLESSIHPDRAYLKVQAKALSQLTAGRITFLFFDARLYACNPPRLKDHCRYVFGEFCSSTRCPPRWQEICSVLQDKDVSYQGYFMGYEKLQQIPIKWNRITPMVWTENVGGVPKLHRA